jgi:hypothetical protein
MRQTAMTTGRVIFRFGIETMLKPAVLSSALQWRDTGIREERF